MANRTKMREGDRPTVVRLTWYCEGVRLLQNPVDVLLDAIGRTPPGLQPLRSGIEPRSVRGKPTEVVAADWAEADAPWYVYGAVPWALVVVDPHPSLDYCGRRYWVMSATCLRDVDAPEWDAVPEVLTEVAERLPAFYARGDVIRNAKWEGGTVAYKNTSDKVQNPIHDDGWLGLPAAPVWLSWFGQPFAEYVHLLPAAQLSATESGWLFRAAQAPSDPDALCDLSEFLPAGLFDTNPFFLRFDIPPEPPGIMPPGLCLEVPGLHFRWPGEEEELHGWLASHGSVATNLGDIWKLPRSRKYLHLLPELIDFVRTCGMSDVMIGCVLYVLGVERSWPYRLDMARLAPSLGPISRVQLLKALSRVSPDRADDALMRVLREAGVTEAELDFYWR